PGLLDPVGRPGPPAASAARRGQARLGAGRVHRVRPGGRPRARHAALPRVRVGRERPLDGGGKLAARAHGPGVAAALPAPQPRTRADRPAALMGDRSELTLADIRAARTRIADALVQTPCTESPVFGDVVPGRLFVKFENLQRTGSFKERGALNKM